MIALTAVGTLGGLTLLLTTALLLAHRRFHVEEDPRIDAVEAMLPGNNCGACGQPGCRAFAEALVTGEAAPAACTVALEAERAEIAAYLGVDVGSAERLVARLACAGGSNVARLRARYEGPRTCADAALVAGGGKACAWGCLGHGDCVTACDFEAIRLDAHDLPVVAEDRCTACGDCVTACPKDLFSLQPADDHLWVRCRNENAGDELLDLCSAACTACGRCAMDAPAGTVTMARGLPLLDTAALRRASDAAAREAIERCPTGAIVWITDAGEEIRGRAARPVVRRSVRPAAAS